MAKKESTVNRTIGGQFETELCERLSEHGWWAHNMTQNQVGQPADVIAVRKNTAVLIDCKVCKNNDFPLSRIEANQDAAMMLWSKRGNLYCYFALKLEDGTILMVSYDELKSMYLEGVSALHDLKANQYFYTLEEWLDDIENRF